MTDCLFELGFFFWLKNCFQFDELLLMLHLFFSSHSIHSLLLSKNMLFGDLIFLVTYLHKYVMFMTAWNQELQGEKMCMDNGWINIFSAFYTWRATGRKYCEGKRRQENWCLFVFGLICEERRETLFDLLRKGHNLYFS